jgi:hypothetical protein
MARVIQSNQKSGGGSSKSGGQKKKGAPQVKGGAQKKPSAQTKPAVNKTVSNKASAPVSSTVNHTSQKPQVHEVKPMKKAIRTDQTFTTTGFKIAGKSKIELDPESTTLSLSRIDPISGAKVAFFLSLAVGRMMTVAIS